MEGISVLILFGFIGGVVRGLVGISKSLANHKKIKIGYFVSTVFISGVVGGLASTIIGVDYRFSLVDRLCWSGYFRGTLQGEAWKNSMIKRRGGFTFTEIVITIAIISVITGLSLSRYNNFTSSAIITNTVIEFIEIIKTVREYSASSYIYGSSSDSFGLYVLDVPINKNEYKLYFTNDENTITLINDHSGDREVLRESFGNPESNDSLMVEIGHEEFEVGLVDTFSLVTDQINLNTIKILDNQPNPNVKHSIEESDSSIRILYKQPDFVPYMVIIKSVNEHGVVTLTDTTKEITDSSIVEFTFSTDGDFERSAHMIIKSGEIILE